MKFSIKKADVLNPLSVVATVSGLKSPGASPAESSRLTFTQSTMSILNANEANTIFVENIPISKVEGIEGCLDKVYSVNTKKLYSIIKGGGEEIPVVITDEKIEFGEGPRRYELSLTLPARKPIEEFKLKEVAIDASKFLSACQDSLRITSNTADNSEFVGTLFTDNRMISSDRNSVLVINQNEVGEDVALSTDLFACCLPKIKSPVYMGKGLDGQTIVLHYDNVTIYKTTLGPKMAKESVDRLINKTMKDKEQAVSITMNMSEFRERFRELKEIVEAEKYCLKMFPDSILISSGNSKSGNNQSDADGEVMVRAKSETPFEGLTAIFDFSHLNILTDLFDGDTKLYILHEDKAVKFLVVEACEKLFIFRPKVA
jgi:hypothetical protein